MLVQERGRGVLRGEAFVAVVEATELENRHDVVLRRRHDLSRDGRIFVEREVSPGSERKSSPTAYASLAITSMAATGTDFQQAQSV